MMKGFATVSILVLAVAILLFFVAVPPYDHVLYHYWTKYHPMARQMKAVHVARGIMVGSTASAALELGLFELLHRQPSLTATEIATALDLPLRGVEPLLQVLTSSDLLYDRLGRYMNSETVEHHWISSLPPSQDLRSMLRIGGSSTLLQAHAKTVDSIRQGGTVLESHAETDSQSFWELFAKHTVTMASKTAADMARQLAPKFSTIHQEQIRVLDIASGSGAYGFAILEQYPQARVIQTDYANVLAITAQNARDRFGNDLISRRLGYVPGNFFELELENDFDVVLAPNIIHHFGPQRTVSFLEKVHSHLKPGGTVVIVELCRATEPYSVWEGPMPMTRTFSMTMLLWSKEGKAYSADEMIQHLTDAGFEQSRVAGKSHPNACFITGQRPAE